MTGVRVFRRGPWAVHPAAMDLSPSALLEASAPYLLAVAAVTLAFVAAFTVAVFVLLHFVQRRRRGRGDASDGAEPDGLTGFAWTAAGD